MIKLSAFATIVLALTSAATAIVPGTYFDRFFMIVFENTNFDKATQNDYLKSLISRNNSVFLSEYSAIAHPSQPNYIATIYGSSAGVLDDGVHDIKGDNLVDRLEAKGISWKAYMEDYPGNCFTDAKSGLYVRKHNPFISMTDISSNSARCANIVNADEIDTDLGSEGLPQFSYYVPNLNNDGHDTSLEVAMNWFQPWFEERLKNPNFTNGTLFLITFDEEETFFSNHIYTSLLGTPVKSGSHEDSTQYSHFSIVKTLVENWNLDNLGREDANATAFTQFLQHP